MLKTQNPDKEYPINLGQKWTEEEEIILLEELSKNIDIEVIAQSHQRTTGGILARCREIAYKMYCKNISIEEIILKTKMNQQQIIGIINKRENNNKVIEKSKIIIEKPFSLDSEIIDIKNDIKEMKNTIKELVEMIKTIYEFENIQF